MKEIIGDILSPASSGVQTIVCHQTNCLGVMGAGLARQIKAKHPNVYDEYRAKCDLIRAGIGGVGDVQYCNCHPSDGYIIANVFGQYSYGRAVRHTNYKALFRAFKQIRNDFPYCTIRIPYKMGCGLAGGDWDVVAKIIEETFGKDNPNVEIWKLP